MTYTSYNFGIEIETIVEPWPRREDLRGNAMEWRRKLARRLENRNLPAKADDHQRYNKHPEYYNTKWFITRDGSLRPTDDDHVAMEIVSPVLNTANSVTVTLSEFWEAMAVGFAVQKAESCGGHVHVTPANSTRRFTLPELKKIAFATFVTENLVQAILPGTRRANRWCKMNSEHKGGGWYRSTKGKLTASTVVDAQRLISQTLSPADLRDFVQGGERDDRYVLWNFQNIAPFGDAQTCSSTVEFRGGSQFLDRPTTLKWVAFVVAFIHLALKEDLLQATRIPFIPKNAPEFDTSMTQWWAKIRESARALKVKRFLPEDWRTMRDQA